MTDSTIASDTYKIVRYHFKGEKEVVVRGLTQEQAQAHCQRDDTKGDGWFDGFVKEQDNEDKDR